MIFWKLNTVKYVKEYLGRKFYKSPDKRHFHWLSVLLFPLQTIHDEYILWRLERYYLINITSQVISLKGYLNDRFDSAQRRIYILTPTIIYNGLWIGLESEVDFCQMISLESEDQGVWLGKFSEQNTGFDFVIYIPSDIVTNDVINQIKSSVYNLKLAGKLFDVEQI